MIKHMIGMVMDDLRDIDMMVDYAEEAKEHGERQEVVNWFAIHAKERLNELERDWREVERELRDRDRGGEIADAMICHISHSIERARAEVAKH